jgi:hypothetical protein
LFVLFVGAVSIAESVRTGTAVPSLILVPLLVASHLTHNSFTQLILKLQ